MSTMYVISNETDEIVATITGSENEQIQNAFMDKFGPNNYSNSYTDFGLTYADDVQEIDLD